MERETSLALSYPQIKYKSQTLYHELPGAGLSDAGREMGRKVWNNIVCTYHVPSSVVQALFFKKKLLDLFVFSLKVIAKLQHESPARSSYVHCSYRSSLKNASHFKLFKLKSKTHLFYESVWHFRMESEWHPMHFEMLWELSSESIWNNSNIICNMQIESFFWFIMFCIKIN